MINCITLRYGLAQKCTDLNDKENEKICMSKALRYSHLIRDRGFIEDVIRFVKLCGILTLSETGASLRT